MKKTITKEFIFDSSHRLNDVSLSREENKVLYGKCNNIPSHGHTYKLFVTVSGEEKHGFIMNFSDLKEIVNRNIVDVFDHQFINDLECMGIKPTTCENMLDVMWDLIVNELNERGIILEELRLYETPTSYGTLSR